MKLQKKAANLRPGDMITCSIYDGDKHHLKRYIIGYHNTNHNKREVLSINSSLFLALNKKGVFKDANKEVTFLEVDRDMYKYYSIFQSVLDKLNRLILKLKRK